MDELFVTCATGLEELLLDELRAMGIKKVRRGFRGVYAPRDEAIALKINYRSRLATRVLWPLTHFPCYDREALYYGASKIKWHNYLNAKKTFSIDANVSHPNLRNSHFAALVVKDALCDYFRERAGIRPSVSMDNPDTQLHLFIQKGFATISLDTSGTPLYKRGYRDYTAVAPIQESLASAVLQMAHFSGKGLFWDPFCGSGTFLIEAAMLLTHTPAGYFRKKWGWMDQPLFDKGLWSDIKAEADSRIIPLEKGRICGSDKDPKTIELCRQHLRNAGFEQMIDVEAKDIRSLFPKIAPNLVVSNPPYGKRLSASVEMMRGLGQFLKTKCAPRAKAAILASEPGLAREIGLPVQETISLVNGGLPVELFLLDAPSPT